MILDVRSTARTERDDLASNISRHAQNKLSLMLFFLFPINTDAPIYHWPFGTVGLIIVNTLVMIWMTQTGNAEAVLTDYGLSYGDGLHPMQWITSNFLHSGWMHLIFNMIFLWSFGIIVEGKLGWGRFVPIYLAIGVIECFIEQLMMLRMGGEGSVGASSVIFGLMSMALVWAPKNELTIFFFLLVVIKPFIKIFEVSILSFSVFFIAMNLALALFWFQVGFVSSELLHLMGGAVGGVFGVMLLKLKVVDCENWDIFAVMNGTYGSEKPHPLSMYHYGTDYTVKPNVKKLKSKRKKKVRLTTDELKAADPPVKDSNPYAASANDESRVSRRSKGLAAMREYLQAGKVSAALNEYHNLRRNIGEFSISAPDLLALGDAVYKAAIWEDAGDIYNQYVHRFPDIASDVRVRLAAILVEKQQRPMAALRVLEPIGPKELSPDLEKYRAKIEKRANQLLDEGVIELEGRAWGGAS